MDLVIAAACSALDLPTATALPATNMLSSTYQRVLVYAFVQQVFMRRQLPVLSAMLDVVSVRGLGIAFARRALLTLLCQDLYAIARVAMGILQVDVCPVLDCAQPVREQIRLSA